jgi:hexosaminidase
MLLPRGAALAEVVWSGKKDRDFTDFQNRMKKHYVRLSARNINFRIPTPLDKHKEILFTESTIKLQPPVENAHILYTLDESTPDENSKIYSEPIPVMDGQKYILNLFL